MSGFKTLKGLVGVVITESVMPFLISRDVIRGLKYSNSPKNIGYDPSKPTPNRIDFPEGCPEKIAPKYARAVFNWASQ